MTFTKTTTLIFALTTILSIQALQFNSTGYFTIVQFTDFHYGGTATEQAETQELQKKILEWVKPDLAVVSGDASSIPGKVGAGWYKSQWDLWTKPFADANVPYAYTLGNHDAEADLNRKQIVQLDQTNPLSLRSQSEGIPDTANFRVPIYASQNTSQLAAHIWVLDSGDYGCEGVDTGYGCIENSVVEWYNDESQKIKDQHGTDVHHLAYFHIPIPEYVNLLNNDPIYGINGEGIWCPVVNTGFFAAAKANGDITAMFCGHDHNNDFGGWHDGIELVYGRKSGYQVYGDRHGARVVVLKENYDSNGKLTITREHYIVDISGSLVYTSPVSRKQGVTQKQCLSGNSLFSHAQKIIVIVLVLLCLL